MYHMWTHMKAAANRRSFLKNGLATAGLATAGAEFLATTASALATIGLFRRLLLMGNCMKQGSGSKQN